MRRARALHAGTPGAAPTNSDVHPGMRACVSCLAPWIAAAHVKNAARTTTAALYCHGRRQPRAGSQQLPAAPFTRAHCSSVVHSSARRLRQVHTAAHASSQSTPGGQRQAQAREHAWDRRAAYVALPMQQPHTKRSDEPAST